MTKLIIVWTLIVGCLLGSLFYFYSAWRRRGTVPYGFEFKHLHKHIRFEDKTSWQLVIEGMLGLILSIVIWWIFA